MIELERGRGSRPDKDSVSDARAIRQAGTAAIR